MLASHGVGGEDGEERKKDIIATIKGKDAHKILDVLEDGHCINFSVVQIPDKEGSELVIELIKLDKNDKINI